MCVCVHETLQRFNNSQDILTENKNKVDCLPFYKVIIIKVTLAQEWSNKLMDQNRNPKKGTIYIWKIDMWQK